MFTIKEVILEEEKQLRNAFLKAHNIDCDSDITYSILVYDASVLVATASITHNVMKCFAIKDTHKNKNITNLMLDYLVKYLSSVGIEHYFVYTNAENDKIFESLHMKLIVKTMNTALLEGGDTIDNVLTRLKNEHQIDDSPKAAIIMNANPMTNGHLHLVETAAKENKQVLVFVVSEDVSKFPFEERFEIITNACSHLENVTVLPTLDYLVSKITFPKYFLKEDQLIKDEQTLVDVLVYKEYFVPIFNIKKRYLGEEPFSYTTNKYNHVLLDYLGSHIQIIKRKEQFSHPISASFVRKLIRANKVDKIADYVPKETMDYLLSEKGQKVIKLIQDTDWSRH